MTPWTSSRTPVRRLRLALMLGIACLFQIDVSLSAVFACPTPSGGTIFQDRPCPMPSETRQTTTVSKSRAPAGMHASWFDRPEYAEGKAVCTRGGCQCGDLQRGHDSGLNVAVADSLYLDGNWHRYEEAVSQWQAADNGAEKNRALRAGVTDAACDILISQETLRRFGGEALRSMRSKARNAEDRGSDYPELCNSDPVTEAPDSGNDLSQFSMSAFTAFDEQACERYTDLLRYRSMVNDAQALRMPRIGVISTTESEALSQW